MKARRRAAPRSKARRAPLRGRRVPMRRKKMVGRPKRKKRALPPIIPLVPKGSPPSYFELLQEAVLTLKDATTGASLPEIRRQLQKKYKGRFDLASNKLLTTALQRLAKRGKVIYKKGYKYKFNAPKVCKRKPEKSADTSASSSAYLGTSRSGASQSGATSGSGPTESDATAGKSIDSHTSATSSYSGTNRSGDSPKDDSPKDKSPEDDEPPENVDDEGKSSTGDLSSSAPSASSTASRTSSKRR